MKIVTVVGNRPQFVKLGVTARALREMGAAAPWRSVVVNTGQHYDAMLSDVFFSELEIEAPQHQLGVGSGPIVDQVGKMLPALREIFAAEQADGVLVYGDTNSTLAAAVAAAHANLPLFHVEGGERLYRRAQMPEEINRVVTDHLANICLCSSRKAVKYLRREGFHESRAVFVGDPMLDIFRLTSRMIEARGSEGARGFGLEPGRFILSTIHRAENTDDPAIATGILAALDAAPMPVLLPAHPRLAHRLKAWGWAPGNALRLIEPLGYFDFQTLLRECALTVSDSGGVNRESFFAGKPCIVPLDSFAWSEAAEAGFSVAVGQDAARIADLLHSFRPQGEAAMIVEHEFGDGHAGERIVAEVARYVESGRRGGEGAWHMLGHYQDLPPAEDRSAFQLRRLDALLAAAGRRWASSPAEAVGADTGLIELDVARDLTAARDVALRLAAAGARAVLFLDPARDGLNPWSDDARALVAEIGAAGHGLGIVAESLDADELTDIARLWSRRFGVPIAWSRGRAAPGLTDIDAATAGWRTIDPAQDAAVPESAGPVRLRILADDWRDVPVIPFEAALVAVDRVRDRQLARVRDAFAR